MRSEVEYPPVAGKPITLRHSSKLDNLQSYAIANVLCTVYVAISMKACKLELILHRSIPGGGISMF